MSNILETLERYILYVFVALYAVFVLPYFPSSYTVPKEAFLALLVCLYFAVWALRLIVKGSARLHIGKFDLAVFLLILAYLASTLIKTSNKMEAFFVPGTVSYLVLGGFLYFLINQNIRKTKENVSVFLIVSGVFLSLFNLFFTSGVFSNIPQLPDFFKTPGANLIGGGLPQIIYLLVLIPLIISFLMRQKDVVMKVFVAVCGLVVLLGIGLTVIEILPPKPLSPKLPSFNDSWQIAVETLKVSPLWGAGGGNYLTAFNGYRPLSYNQSELWNVRFTSAHNFYLTAMTEAGFAAVFALALLLLGVYRLISKNFNNSHLISLVFLLILFAFFPASPVLIVLLFILLSLSSSSEEKSVNINLLAQADEKASPIAMRIPAMVVGIIILATVSIFCYFAAKAVHAEYVFAQSLTSLSNNKAKDTYDQMNKAIALNPYVDRYHSSLAQVEMAIAGSLASKEAVSEDDRNTITQLIQQAISNGKATVTLNPQRAGNWEVLARIYQSIMPFAQGADNFTIQTYAQAVALDPINPNLRIALGGIYYSLGKYDEAIDSFKLAVLAKSDLANAHYNLSMAYKEKKDIQKAIDEMKLVLSLVNIDSEDYRLASNELQSLEKNLPVPTESTEVQGELTPPQQSVEPVISPPIELPFEATPPAGL
ncbi:tetratricopeptide repeat protein [Patescibacteria group bacterium]